MNLNMYQTYIVKTVTYSTSLKCVSNGLKQILNKLICLQITFVEYDISLIRVKKYIYSSKLDF